MNQTCRTLLEKQGRCHKWCTPMAEQKQDEQLEHTYSSYLRILDVALKTCQRWWRIRRSGDRGSGISDMMMMIYIFGRNRVMFIIETSNIFYPRYWYSLSKNITKMTTYMNKYTLSLCLSVSVSVSTSISLSLSYTHTHTYIYIYIVVFWPSTRPKMPFQGDAPEGGDTF